MGMQNSAQSFQRLVESVLGGLEGIFVYLDDILIFSKNEADHIKILENLFKRLEDAGLSIALDKCEFGVSQLDYLGYTINKQGIHPIKKKVSAIQSFPEPQNRRICWVFWVRLITIVQVYQSFLLINITPNRGHRLKFLIRYIKLLPAR